MNHPNGWMPGWMDGGMWMWMWSGICIVVLALVAIGINVMSKK